MCSVVLRPRTGLVNAPRRWYHRVATDLRNMRGEEISHRTLLVDFPRRKRRHSCPVFGSRRRLHAGVQRPYFFTRNDMKRSVVSRTARPNGCRIRGCPPWLANRHPSGTNNLYEWRTWESGVLTQCGVRITQAYDKTHQKLGGFEIHFAEHAKEVSLITLPLTSTPREKIPNHST